MLYYALEKKYNLSAMSYCQVDAMSLWFCYTCSVLQFNIPAYHSTLQISAPESDKKMEFMRGEPLVRKLAVLSKYGVLPGAMIAALIYSPPDYASSSKKHASAASK